jgi:putative flippase GtrA
MRGLKFTAVGAMGAGLQVALLALLSRVAGMHYLLATALAVETTILHNFLWHWRWTWNDRLSLSGGAGSALLRFNLTNGLVSISSNLLAAYLLTGLWGVDPVLANVVSITVGALVNFVLSDRVVFVPAHAKPQAEARPCAR